MGITTTGTAGTARFTKTVNITIGSKGGSKESSTKGRGGRKNRNRGRGVWSKRLDDMIDKLCTRKGVEKDIRDRCWKREFAQRLANFSHANEDGNPVMMTKNATRGFGASSRDANYRENVRHLVGGGREKGFCADPKCDHPEMELLHKCAACKRFVHIILCSMANDLGGEDDCFYCSRHCHPS
jgi:hypothetical protein